MNVVDWWAVCGGDDLRGCFGLERETAEVMGNFAEALAAEVERLRKVLERIRDVPGADIERAKLLARQALEQTSDHEARP